MAIYTGLVQAYRRIGGASVRSMLLPAVLFAARLLAQPTVVAVNVDSVIHPVTAEIVRNAIAQAQREHAVAVLIRLDTPGGLLEATRETDSLLLSSPVPVVTLVTPSGARAASAGFFILLAGNVAAMTEGTNAGAASPVLMGQTMDPVMRKKVESDSAAAIRSIASRRGRNAEAAEKAVFEAKSFTGEEALTEHLIDLVVRDEADLWARIDGREVALPDGVREVLRTKDAKVTDYRMSVRERVVSAMADPNLAFLLLMLGALLLYVEFTNPGMILPGVAGAILFVLALLALSVLPINMAAVALLLLAAALFVLEAKIASHGVLGAGGAVAMVLGATLLVEGPPEMRIRLSTALAVTIPFALIVIFLVSLVVKARLRPATTGIEGMLAAHGVTQTEVGGKGTILIHGEYWNARSEKPIPPGTEVSVTAVDGLWLQVEPVPMQKKET